MKMTKQDYQALRAACATIRVQQPNITPASYRVGGGSAQRFRWDLMYASGFNIRPLYKYLNDQHIDMALRSIVCELYSAWQQY